MRFFDMGQHAEGFIAIGQEATGFIAIGQMAIGFIAIGQMARGVVAIGQLAVGVWGVGMVGMGVGWFLGGGPSGRGIANLIPDLNRPREYPSTTSLDVIRSTGDPGFVRGELRLGPAGQPQIFAASGPLPVKMSVARLHALRHAVSSEYFNDVIAQIVPHGEHLICERVIKVTPSSFQKPGVWLGFLMRTAGLCVIAAGVWLIALLPLFRLALWDLFSLVY